jgi:protein-S-isoprenylcysteine O-methyltransferase Ste14
MPWCVALISLAASASFVLLTLAIAFVESRENKTKGTLQILRSDPWKPVLGGFCAAALAGASTAEFAAPEFGMEAEHHPVLTTAVAGMLLSVIALLAIEAPVRLLTSRASQRAARQVVLEGPWSLVLRQGRRGAYDLGDVLGRDFHVTVNDLPEPQVPKPSRHIRWLGSCQ